mmetsp:Transcript_65341/g.194804  ORF Transcript_65341/g.194804 Transcript_65341/m.194804 type:complete len:308 (+) Transcript_65341:3-926(+)
MPAHTHAWVTPEQPGRQAARQAGNVCDQISAFGLDDAQQLAQDLVVQQHPAVATVFPQRPCRELPPEACLVELVKLHDCPALPSSDGPGIHGWGRPHGTRLGHDLILHGRIFWILRSIFFWLDQAVLPLLGCIIDGNQLIRTLLSEVPFPTQEAQTLIRVIAQHPVRSLPNLRQQRIQHQTKAVKLVAQAASEAKQQVSSKLHVDRDLLGPSSGLLLVCEARYDVSTSLQEEYADVKVAGRCGNAKRSAPSCVLDVGVKTVPQEGLEVLQVVLAGSDAQRLVRLHLEGKALRPQQWSELGTIQHHPA